MKWLYKYPQSAFPYDDLVKTNAHRSRGDHEYELIDTGVFDRDRYFDVVVEYAKSSPEECFIRITVANRGPETATIHLLPTLWFRNTWSWWPEVEKPHLKAAKGSKRVSVVSASHPELGDRRLYCDGAPPLLFTENDTNTERLFDAPNPSPYVKDAFHAFVVHGKTDAVNPAAAGTKAAAHYRLEVGAGQSVEVRLCLTDASQGTRPFAAFEKTVEARRREADEFYASLTPESASEDRTNVMRQDDPSYDDLVYKFAEHFLWIRAAINKVGHDGMWDEEDGFYYDVLRLPDGSAARLKVRSLVGLLPLCATTIIERSQRERVPRVVKALEKRFGHIPELLGAIHPMGPEHTNAAGRTLSALVDADRLRRILRACSTKGSSSVPTASARCRGFTSRIPTCCTSAGRSTRSRTRPPSRTAGCSAGTPTGAVRCGFR